MNISLNDWNGSVASVEVDGKNHGSILWQPYSFSLKGPFKKGTHYISLEVVGNIGNLMGPHFKDGRPNAWTWLDSPDKEPEGAEYKISPYGLEQSFEISIK